MSNNSMVAANEIATGHQQADQHINDFFCYATAVKKKKHSMKVDAYRYH